MRKTIAAIMAMLSFGLFAADGEVITNKIYIVSNVYYRVFTTHEVTNNFYEVHTNHEFHIDHQTLVVSQTNINTTATFDMGRSMLSIMSNDVNTAKASIQSTADAASGSASSASEAASRASSSAASAQGTLNTVNSRGSEIINAMNAKQAWFDQNYGKMITNHNIYVAEDQVARAGVAQNAADIASLESRVGDNIQQLTTRMGTAETNISSLGTRMGTAEGNIGNLNTSVSGLTTRIGAAENEIEVVKSMVGVATNYVISVDDSEVPEAVFEMGYKNSPQNVVLAYVKIRRGYVNNETTNPNIQYTNGWACTKLDPTHNTFSKYNDRWWYSSTNPAYNYLTISFYGGNDYFIAYWRNIQYDGDPYNFPTVETTDCDVYWAGVSGRTFYCKLISNTINKRTDLKYIQGTDVFDKNGNKVDELIFRSEVSSDTQRLESHIRTADRNFENIFERLREIEGSVGHKNYVYTFTRDAVQIGTLTVNTENPTLDEETTSYLSYSFPYSATWAQSSSEASPSVLSCKKRIYKNGLTKPAVYVRFSTRSGTYIDMISENTTDSVRSYFKGDIQFTTYETGGTNPRTFILRFSHTTD